MKTALLFISLTSLCLAAKDNASVRFANGDKLSGNAVALNPNTLTWESAILKGQAQFNLDQILDLTLPAKMDSKADVEESYQALLELTNGDTVKGLLVALDEKEIRLKTWYAGEMVFPRINVKAISISENMKVFYRGPNGMAGWEVSGGEDSWVYSNDELTSNKSGSVARNINFPDKAQISYDISWRGRLQSKVMLFSSDITTDSPETGYEIIFHGNSLRLRRIGQDKILNSRVRPRRTQRNEIAKVEIRFNKTSERLMVFMDDQLCGLWDNVSTDETPGKGLHFISLNNTEIGISNIVVSEWDGKMDESIDEDMPIQFQIQRNFPGNVQFNQRRGTSPKEEAKLSEGRMMLSNGDTIEGEVLGIDGEMIKIKTPFAEVTFPVKRIRNIALKKIGYEKARLYGADVRAHLADGSIFVFRLEDVKDGKLIGFSQNFGMAEFKQSAFRRIEFNIHP